MEKRKPDHQKLPAKLHYKGGQIRKGLPTKRFLLIHREITASGCWEWTRAKWEGYGSVTVHNRHKRVHRVAYELWRGPIPNGLCVLHKCDNRSCFNPNHLFLGSRVDNIHDCIQKGRRKYNSGSAHHQAKLTDAQIIEIRRLHIPLEPMGIHGKKIVVGSLKWLSKKFGVSVQQIWRIILRKNWKHL